MNKNGDTTFKPGNTIGSNGRHQGSKSKAQLMLQQIGEDNAYELLMLEVQKGKNGDSDSRRFVIDKIMPNAKGSKHITIDLPPITDLASIGEAQNFIIAKTCEGSISLDEGERLMDMTETRRKVLDTMEASETRKLMEIIDKRLKDAGFL